jgi:hypothetical protein
MPALAKRKPKVPTAMQLASLILQVQILPHPQISVRCGRDAKGREMQQIPYRSMSNLDGGKDRTIWLRLPPGNMRANKSAFQGTEPLLSEQATVESTTI